MIFLDSDILINFFKDEEEAIRAVQKAIASGEEVRISTVSGHEVLYGESGKNLEDAKEFIQAIGIVDYSWDEMIATIKLRKDLKKRGNPIGVLDEMIAGTCKANNASIMTRNKKHFSKVKGLKLESW